MAAATHARHPSNPPFNPVDTSLRPTSKDEVESPSLSNANALARFEFEPGMSKEGTKILMVEWEDDAATRAQQGSWQISWEGKTHVLPADDNSQSQAPTGERGTGLHRMYFMLPPGVTVPGLITLSKGNTHWKTNPLPAIFPPELGASARQAGKKGVLHTIWAKKRLQALQREIDTESKQNVEGIALTMILQEKEWIEQHFGVSARPSGLSIATGSGSFSSAPLSPGSPKSPGGGRLMEKLKGLKLGTSDKDLGSPSSHGPLSGGSHESNPLSPETSDVAVSSFAAFKGANPSQLGAKPPQLYRKVSSQGPPASVLAQQQQQSTTGMGSLDALAGGPVWESRGPAASAISEDDDKEDGLFALPISPRSPEMGKSPFSFARTDTQKYSKEGQPA